jgi:hypothetical protein
MSAPNSNDLLLDEPAYLDLVEIGDHDPLEAHIARMVENAELRDGWLGPIEQEDMTEVYEALGIEAKLPETADGDEWLEAMDVFCVLIQEMRL